MRMIGCRAGAGIYVQADQVRVAFGKPISEQTVTLERIAESRIMIDSARLLVLRAAHMMDTVVTRSPVPRSPRSRCCAEHGLPGHRLGDSGAWRGGVSDDFPLAYAYAHAAPSDWRWADEVHRNQIGRLELKKYEQRLSN